MSNFINSLITSTYREEEYIDATMALHNEGALYLSTHPDARGLIEPQPELEKHLLEICRFNGSIADELDLI